MPRVFISYGRADADTLATRLVRELTDAGHDVWLDRSEIKAGRAWEEQIEAGILASDVVIALLTPHAVRRPNGVCLDEISLARHSGRRIIPLMVLQCRPPLGIYRLDWIDFQNWQVAATFDRALAQLTTTIDTNADSVEGAYAALFSQLRPMDFGSEVSRLTRIFIGREWLFEQINQWLSRDDSRLFLITGEPGIGKSALLAALIHRHPSVRAYHFCIADLADSLDPVRFIESIAAQLATQLDSYRAALEAVVPGLEREADPGTLLRRLVADPLRAAALSEPLIIVVDALDESLGYLGRTIAKLIAERLDELPPSVRLVVSSRENAEILDLFSAHSPRAIDATHENNLRDAASFVRSRLTEPPFAEVVHTYDMQIDALSDVILSKSKGNFLYIRHTMDALRTGQLDPRRPDAFPDGLIGVYHAFFQRVFSDAADYATVRPLLDIIVVSRDPLTASQIAACVNRDLFDVEGALQRLADFFPERDSRYQAFHKSISDWLSGTVGRSRRFRVNQQNGHGLLATQSWREHEHGAEAMSDYSVLHGVYHLHQAGRRLEEQSLTSDPGFIRRRITLNRGIYLSHSYRDYKVVAQVAEYLNAHDHAVFVSVPGDSEDEWRQQISSAIPSASVVIGFVHARNSPYLRAEWQVAQSSGTPLLLILAEDSPWLSGAAELAGVPCVDARLLQNSDADHADTWSQLSALIGRGVGSSRRLGANVTPVGVDLARYRRLLDSLDRSSGTV